MFKKSLSKSSIVYFLVTLSILISVIKGTSYFEQKDALNKLKLQSALLSSRIDALITSELHKGLDDLNFLVQLADSASFGFKESSSMKVAELLLKSYLVEHPSYAELYVYNNNGPNIFLNKNPDNTQIDTSYKPDLNHKHLYELISNSLEQTLASPHLIPQFVANNENNENYKLKLFLISKFGDKHGGLIILGLDTSELFEKISKIVDETSGLFKNEVLVFDENKIKVWQNSAVKQVNQDMRIDYESMINSKQDFIFDGKNAYYIKSFCGTPECKNIENGGAETPLIDNNNVHFSIVVNSDFESFISSVHKRDLIFNLVFLMLILLVAIFVFNSIKVIKVKNELENVELHAKNSESFLDEIFSNSPTMMVLLSLGGSVVRFNKAFGDFFHTDASLIMGRNFSEFSASKASNTNFSEQQFFEDIWINKDGEAKEVYVVRFHVKDKNFDSNTIALFASDITEFNSARRLGIEKTTYLSAIVNSTPDTVLIVDNGGKVIFSNNQLHDLFGWKVSEVVGKGVEMLIPSNLRDKHKTLRKEFNKKPQRKVMAEDLTADVVHDVMGLRKDGSSFDVEITLCPVMIDGVQSTVCIVRDITEKLKMEYQIRKSQRIDAVGTLSGGIAHDFNNLLGVIIGNLDLLDASASNEKQKKRIQIALSAAEKGAEMTKRLLAFSRKQNLDPQVVDLQELILNLRPLLIDVFASSTEVKTDIVLKSQDPIYVFVDSTEFENIILNMAINSRDAFSSGHGHFTVSTAITTAMDLISLSELRGTDPDTVFAEITISDDGDGISRENQTKIFEPFFSTKKDSNKGTGLGLAVAHGFIKQSKGFIKVYSEMGYGTQFKILLPVVNRDGSVSEIKHNYSNVPDIEISNQKFVIVDDNIEMADVVRSNLELLGATHIRIYVSSNELSEDNDCLENTDIIISDIVMPDNYSGIELHQIVKDKYPDILFIFVSGFSDDAIKLRSEKNIIEHYIQKPFRADELKRVLYNALNKL